MYQQQGSNTAGGTAPRSLSRPPLLQPQLIPQLSGNFGFGIGQFSSFSNQAGMMNRGYRTASPAVSSSVGASNTFQAGHQHGARDSSNSKVLLVSGGVGVGASASSTISTSSGASSASSGSGAPPTSSGGSSKVTTSGSASGSSSRAPASTSKGVGGTTSSSSGGGNHAGAMAMSRSSANGTGGTTGQHQQVVYNRSSGASARESATAASSAAPTSGATSAIRDLQGTTTAGGASGSAAMLQNQRQTQHVTTTRTTSASGVVTSTVTRTASRPASSASSVSTSTSYNPASRVGGPPLPPTTSSSKPSISTAQHRSSTATGLRTVMKTPIQQKPMPMVMQLGLKQPNAQLNAMTFNQKHPPVAPAKKLDTAARFEAAVAAMKREGPLRLSPRSTAGSCASAGMPGGQPAAIGMLDGKLIVRGPKAVLDQMKKNSVLKELEEKEALAWCEEGPVPSDTLIALDFDKTLVKNFLWADLGGLQGASIQKNNLVNWVRDGRLKKLAFGGDERITRLREAIQARLDRGDFVCVLSSGFASVIKVALQHVGLSDILPQDLIYGCDTQPYGINKSTRLAKLREKHRRTRAVLIDDDLNYCRQAIRDGHHAIWVKDGQGIEESEMHKLKNSLWDQTL
ncbi:unnamed protein product [Amoebophrya sp. A25]|nr:unnamed protein product [Amoebophrya sp. A25]|eukprot:GSA25T00004488001.1